MNSAEAKEYILALFATLKLTEKEIRLQEDESAKWRGRMDLARSRGIDDLLAEAEKEAQRADTKLAGLREEKRDLANQIEALRQQLPGLAARERTIDPDLLEQELLAILGRTGEEAETERTFCKLEKESAADAALEALKEKLKEEKQ